MGATLVLKNQSNSKGHVLSLLKYLKKKSEDDLNEFASSCGTTPGNLLQIAYGGSVSATLSKKINEKSKGVVLLADLRPDIFL
ncbi:hypothetical protein F938_00824 [Acinetobacter bereziniae LMG 1003 = CIP 70.12]|uniref:Uncharacterized protein n=1 Tax=Acinetobacter bereziniae LMG 1003 = CIP 70.12 TaxID=981324 RepID=N9EYV8_ACIBZ|nr:hypothetical protein [Acinetobacter bereziniae]ENW00180.1 hypothetical protein F938_00824 [Acinetobacter bereziniae LMG 1003 = CIP 70.12]